MPTTALITGITGQDGAYLSSLLIKQGYEVVGLIRSYSHLNKKGLDYLNIGNKVKLLECDLTDLSQVISIVKEIQPSEIYNLAAQSSVSLSFKQPIGTISFNIISVLNLLEAVRLIKPDIKFYQASSSEIFGTHNHLPITETSSITPISPYSISKASAYWITQNYRDAYNLFACSGILFNHESFLRSDNFFVKKVIIESIKIKAGLSTILNVGNIDIKRDFGWAPKYVEAMYLMLQQNKPDDFLICSNISVSLRSIIEFVFDYVGISLNKLVISEALYRPTEIDNMYGDNTKATKQLGWEYAMSFYDVLKILIDEEIKWFNGQ
jgi:GDPmannose 4,6-dehydratase